MIKHWQRNKGYILSLFYALGATLIVLAMFIWPQETYEGSRYGLELWATVLVPSLLPFFIIAEILLNLGVVHLLGELLDPIMRPLFNLPGTTSFALAMGLTSGFPMGAVLTKRLYEENLCSRKDGQRLVAFTNNSSPLFILVAIAIGMFNNPLLGYILALAHYISNLIIGICLGLSASPKIPPSNAQGNILVRGTKALLIAQKTRKPWGILLGDSIKKGIQNITLIGGFVVVFSLLIKLLSASSLMQYITSTIGVLLNAIGCDAKFSPALASGFWELTLGLKELSKLPATLTEQAVIASVLLGWSGLSIQSQVMSVLSGSDISSHLYHWCRVLQGVVGGVLAYLLTSTIDFWSHYISLPVSVIYTPPSSFFATFSYNFLYVWNLMFIFFAILILLIPVLYFFKFLKIFWQKIYQ